MSRRPGSGQRGERVSIRPLKMHEPDLQEKAVKRGMTVARYVTEIVDSFLDGRWEPVRKNPSATHSADKQEALGVEDNQSADNNPVCRHPNHTVIGGGLHRCTNCGQTRNIHGTWS